MASEREPLAANVAGPLAPGQRRLEREPLAANVAGPLAPGQRRLEREPLAANVAGPLAPGQRRAPSTNFRSADRYDLSLLNKPVHATGEPFGAWYSRRLSAVLRERGNLPMTTLLEIASAPIPDEQVAGVTRLAAELGLTRHVHDDPARVRARLAKQAERFGRDPDEFVASVGEQTQIARETGAKEAIVGGLGTVFGPLSKPVNELVLEPGSAWVQYLQGQVGNLFNIVDPSDKPRFPEPITLAQAYRNANLYGPGQAVAVHAGLQPGSKPAFIVGAMLELIGAWYADPTVVLGKAVKGVRLAERVPLIDEAGVAATAGRSKITQHVYRKLAKAPEELVQTPVVRAGNDAIWTAVQKGATPEALIDRFRLPNEVAQDIVKVANRSELDDVVVDALYGRMMKTGVDNATAQVKALNMQLAALTPGTPAYARIEASRDRVQAALDSGLSPKVRLGQAPQDSVIGALREAVKRPHLADNPLIAQALGVLDKKWARNFTRTLPRDSVSLMDKDAGRIQLVRLGDVLGLSRPAVDDFVDTFLASTSRGEAVEVVTDMLKAGRRNLPPGMAVALTQITAHPSNSLYWLDRVGNRVRSWVRTTSRGGLDVDYAQPHLWIEHAAELPLPYARAILEATRLRGRMRLAILQQAKRVQKSAASANPVLRGTSKAVGVSLQAVPEVWLGAEQAVAFLTTVVWKPSVLLRLGWPIKIVAEEQARLAARGIPSLFHRPWEWMGNLRNAALRVPEDALAEVGRHLVLPTRAARGRVTQGERGFANAYQTEVLHLRSDPVVRHYLDHGYADTLTWLQSGSGGAFVDDMRPTWAALRVPDEAAYLDTVVQRVDELADDPALRAVIRDGRGNVNGVDVTVDSEDFAQLVEDAVANGGVGLPARVKDVDDVWLRRDVGLARRATVRMFDALGAKPTNWLSRRPAWRHFYQNERKRLEALYGVQNATPAALARRGKVIEEQARTYATNAVRDLLFDLGERSAFVEMNRIAAPFLNAYQEVFSRWLVTIPGDIAPGLGQVVMARRLQMLDKFALDTGLVKLNAEGQREVDVFGWRVPVRSLMPLGMGFPFSGPVVQGLAGPIAKELQEHTQAFNDVIELVMPYGPDASLGPAWMGHAYRWATGKTPFWEFLSTDYQNTLWDGAQIEVMRELDADTGVMRRIAAIEDPEKRAEEVEAFLRRARSIARGRFGARAARGWLLPAQPRHYWKDKAEADAFSEKFFAMLPQDRPEAKEEFLKKHPGLATFLLAKSFSTKNEPLRENARERYWQEWRQGARKRFTAEEWANIGVGWLAYESYRETEREALMKLGQTAPERLARMHEVMQIAAQRRVKVEGLELGNAMWAKEFRRTRESAAKREGRPLPDAEEQQLLDVYTALGNLLTLVDADGDRNAQLEIDWAEVRQLRHKLRELVEPERFYSERELKPGVERDLTWYFREVFDPYMTEVDKRLSKAEGADSTTRQAIFEDFRRWRNAQDAAVRDDDSYPRPEEVLFAMRSPQEQAEQRVKWSMRPFGLMTNFQREELGLPVSSDAEQFWDSVNDARAQVRKWIIDNNLSPSEKAAVEARENLKVWEAQVAQTLGMEREYLLDDAAPYERVVAVNMLPAGDVWEASVQAADSVWSYLTAIELGPTAAGPGQYLRRTLHEYLDQLRAFSPEFDAEIEEYRKQTRYVSADAFYDFFYLGIGE